MRGATRPDFCGHEDVFRDSEDEGGPGSPTNSVSLQMLQNMAGLRIAVLDSEAQSKRIKDDAATAQ